MIPVSGRHVLPAILALCVLAIPTGYHSLLRPRVDDCTDPARLRAPDFLPSSAGVNPHQRRGPKEMITWSDGELATDRPWIQKPQWRIARAYDLAKFYFDPPGLFSRVYPDDTNSLEVREANGVDLPIHVLVGDSDGFMNIAAYLYVFAGRPVRHPFFASLHNAIRQFVGGTLPLTLILVEGDSKIEHAQEAKEILVDWIRSAWIALDGVCSS